MKTKTTNNVADGTYFRTGDAEPTIEPDGSITLLDGRGSRRSWGAPQTNTTILIDADDFLAVLVGFSHKHGGSQFYRYFVQTPTGPARRTWAQLTDDERQMVLDAYDAKAPAWANRPGKLSTERRKPSVERWTAYKLVRNVDGQLLSYYDSSAWELGKTRTEAARENHGGGYYVHASVETMKALHANENLVPAGEGVPTLIECECWGNRIQYSSGKIAVTYCKPVRSIETW